MPFFLFSFENLILKRSLAALFSLEFKITATKPDVIATLVECKCSLIFNYSVVIALPIKLHLLLSECDCERKPLS